MKAIKPRFHPNPPPKSTAKFCRDYLTDKNAVVCNGYAQTGLPVEGPILQKKTRPVAYRQGRFGGHGHGLPEPCLYHLERRRL